MSTPSSMVGEQNSAGRKTLGSPAWRSSSFLLGKLLAVLFAPAEAPFPPFPPLLIDLGGVLAAFEPEQCLASASPARRRACDRELDEIGVRRLAVGAACPLATRRTAFAASRQPSTSKRGRHLPNQLVLRGRLEQAAMTSR